MDSNIGTSKDQPSATRSGVDSKLALAALLAGCGSLLLCGLPSPFALVLAILARRQVRASPGTYRNERHATYGMVLSGLGTSLVLLALLGNMIEALRGPGQPAPPPPPRPVLAAAPTAAKAPARTEKQVGSAVAAAPTTPEDAAFEQQLAEATDIEAFAVDVDDTWALLPPGATQCGKDENGEVEHMDEPEAVDEFERRRKKAERGAIREKYVGTLLAASGMGNWGDGGFAFGGHYEASLSKYDFRKHVYKARLAAETSVLDAWPIGDKTAPVFGTEAWLRTSNSKIGSVEGFLFDRDVNIEHEVSDVEYVNGSNLIIKLTMPEADAEAFRAETASVEVLLRFEGLGFHKVCRNECATLFGITDCGSTNIGAGEHKLAKTVGWRIRSAGKTVAIKVPAASTSKPAGHNNSRRGHDE